MRSYARGTKAVLPGRLAREVCEAYFCSVKIENRKGSSSDKETMYHIYCKDF